jgi:AcrR family transcriptional regulator
MTKGRTKTPEQILAAAAATVRSEGFAGATTRAIARRGDFNQALVFYYFGSLDGLLVAVLDRTAAERLARYREALADVDSLAELFLRLRRLHAEDRESGHVRVLSQLIAGALTRPELAPAVVERLAPWRVLTDETIARLLAGSPVEQVAPTVLLARAALTYYLGASLLGALAPDEDVTEELLVLGGEAAPLLSALLRPE